MSWQDIMRRVLQPTEMEGSTFEPHRTSGWGWRFIDGGWEFHRAADFNYNVGPKG
jgi:hypothetical protein